MTEMLTALQAYITQRTARIGVIGLGYVGLPVACTFASSGFRVVGVDIARVRVEQINRGENPIQGKEPGLDQLLRKVIEDGSFQATDDYAALSDCEIILISVDTPVDDAHLPDYTHLRQALQQLGRVIQAGSLVILESTVSPGTTAKLVGPLLAATSGYRLNQDFFVGCCPERVMPGVLLRNIRTMNRVCGGSSPAVAETMRMLYHSIVEADLDLTDTLTAELVKTSENAYRDVQIAFANEIALICEATGADAWKVRELVNKSPYRQMHLPGSGVGGHCIPKDPWLLADAVRDRPDLLQVIPAARQRNESMPKHTLELILDGLAEAGCDPEKARVLILGVAYLDDSDDTRNSPSLVLEELLAPLVSEVRMHDTHVPGYQGEILEMANNCDAIVLMVRHSAYLTLDLGEIKRVMRTAILIDGRGTYEPERLRSQGFTYRGIGRPRGTPEDHSNNHSTNQPS